MCELVDLDGRPASADTIDWRDLDLAAAIEAPRVVLESDVRAAALAEAAFGAASGRSPFLFAIVGTGASVCLVVDGRPYAGCARAGDHARRPAGRARRERPRARAWRPGSSGPKTCSTTRRTPALVDAAAAELGRVLAVLANALDPTVIVLGGGLGTDARRSGMRVEAACRPLLEYPASPPLAVVASALGADGGIVGAAHARRGDG